MYKTVEYDPDFIDQKVLCEVGMKAIIQNEVGEILLLRRSTKVALPGKWGLPGGGIELNEDPLEGIKREIWEETQLTVTQIKIFAARSLTNPAGDFTVIIGYRAQLPAGATVTINWEHDQFQWLHRAAALELPNLTETTRIFIEQLEN